MSASVSSTEMAYLCHVCFPPDSDHSADIWGGPFRAISEVGPALFNRFGSAHRAPGSIDTPGLLTWLAVQSFAAVATRLECVALYWPPVPRRGHCQRRMEVFVSPRCFSTG